MHQCCRLSSWSPLRNFNTRVFRCRTFIASAPLAKDIERHPHPKPLALKRKSPLVPEALVAKLQRSKRLETHGRNKGRDWNLKDYARAIGRLIGSMPTDPTVQMFRHKSFSKAVPSQFRPQLLTEACYSFLHLGKLGAALTTYRLLVSERFVPPISLVVTMYYAICRKATRNQVVEAAETLRTIPFDSLDPGLFCLLLSALVKSGRVEIMEEIVQDYATRVSSFCLTDASVATSMIQAYRVARQLDGCYSWFYRFRSSSARSSSVPPTPYVSLMSASRKLDPANTKALYRILKMMQEDGVARTVAAFNELLASELDNRNLHHVFTLYSALKEANIEPDSHTYHLIFDALWKNEVGSRYDVPILPTEVLRQMIFAAKSGDIYLRSFHIDAAIRYFANVGDFRSALLTVNAARYLDISPTALTIRSTLGEVLKRYQKAFDPSADLELQRWAKLFLGGLTRDHFAHAVHLVDVVESTRSGSDPTKLTRSSQDALQLVRNILVSRRPRGFFSSTIKQSDTPVFSLIHDVLRICAFPTYGLPHTILSFERHPSYKL